MVVSATFLLVCFSSLNGGVLVKLGKHDVIKHLSIKQEIHFIE